MDAPYFESTLFVALNEVYRLGPFRQRREYQAERGLSRFRHPELFAQRDAVARFDRIGFAVRPQGRFFNDLNPVFRAEVGVDIKDRSGVAQCDFIYFQCGRAPCVESRLFNHAILCLQPCAAKEEHK